MGTLCTRTERCQTSMQHFADLVLRSRAVWSFSTPVAVTPAALALSSATGKAPSEGRRKLQSALTRRHGV